MIRVSLCTVAYNEEKILPSLLEDFKKQTYPHNFIEIILVDGNSTDSTLRIMNEFKNENSEFESVKVENNPKRIQAAGWNKVIETATGDVVIRIDAHSSITEDFVEKNVRNIKAGEDVCGGKRQCIIEDADNWRRMLLKVENSLFGSSVNKCRHSDEKTYVKTVFHACYKKEVIDKVGKFNEKLLRTEDNEYHYRVGEAGYKIRYDPEILSYQYARSSLKKMIKQKFGNGYWIGLTLGICPGCISLFHLVPLAFVFGIIFTLALLCCNIYFPFIAMWSAYVALTILNTVISIKNEGATVYDVLMPFMFLILHVCYGIGTLIGLIQIPGFRKKYKENSNDE